SSNSNVGSRYAAAERSEGVVAVAARAVAPTRTHLTELTACAVIAAVDVGLDAVAYPVAAARCAAMPGIARAALAVATAGARGGSLARLARPATVDVGFTAIADPIAAW